MNVFENVDITLRKHTKLSPDMLRDLVIMMLEAVGLRGAAKLMVDQLSGGMARRVALARAVIMGPELLLYDEPFTGQDPIARGVIIKLIRQLNYALGLSSVVVSHDVHETATIADFVYIIFQGAVIGAGTPDQVINNKSEDIQQIVRGLPDGAISFHHPAGDYRKDLDLC